VRSGVLRNGGGGRRMIYNHVTAFVVAAAHVAISRHLLAAFHFCGSHPGIRKANEQWSGRRQEGDAKCESAAELHFLMLLRWANDEKSPTRSMPFGQFCCHCVGRHIDAGRACESVGFRRSTAGQ
jgi:hypothetical protein